MDIDRWLQSLGLEAYASAFAEHAIDRAALPLLSMEDLKEIGVLPVGHRRKILAAIAELEDGAAPSGTAEAEAPVAPADALRGERRQVAVLFADIAGYTALSAALDAERLHGVLSAYFEAVDEVIERLGGRIDKHIGDSAMAVFGAPVAHPDDVLRAVRAALSIHAAMERVSDKAGQPLAAHIGLAAGEVVASPTGSAHHREYTVTGDTVNLAARLTHLARAGETVVSGDVLNALAGRLDAEPMGPQVIKGLADPVEAWRVRGLGEAAVVSDRPMIGRRSELAQCVGALRAASGGDSGSVLYIRGEAGIGKSRLVRNICQEAESLGFACHIGAVYDFGAGLERDPLRTIGLALQGGGAVLGESDDGLLLKDLLGLPLEHGERTRLDAMSHAARAAGRSEVLATLAVSAARSAPVLIVVEDLHWADAGTLRALDVLARQGLEIAPIVLALTSRLENDPLAGPNPPFTGLTLAVVELGPLRDRDARSMAESLLDKSNPLVEQCLARAQGHPLFLEQLVRNARAGGVTEAIPGSIQSVVLAQVDRLAPGERSAIQAAAVLGDQFAADGAAHVMDRPGFPAERLLAARLIRPLGETLQFAHALIREGVYSSLLHAERRRLHARAAEWFAGRDPTLRAEHLAKAGDPAAAGAFLEAAHMLARAFRLEEALACVQRGLAADPAGAIVVALGVEEGNLLLELGRTDDALGAFDRTEAAASDAAGRAMARLGRASVLRVIDRVKEALRLLEEAEPAFTSTGDEAALARLEHLRGNLLFPLGLRQACWEAHERALAHAERCGSIELKARALGGLGDAAYADGRYATAARYFDECVTLAREHGLGRVEVVNLPMLLACRTFFHDPRSGLAAIQDVIDLARSARQPRAEMIANHIAISACLWAGQASRVEPLIARAQEIVAQLGTTRFEPENLALLGEALRQLGELERADEVTARAVELVRQTDLIKYFGAIVFGYRALAMWHDPAQRKAALAEGEALSGPSEVAHNALFFGLSAVEASLLAGDYAEARRYAQRLADAFSEEPAPLVDLVVERAALLAAVGEEGPNAVSHERLAACRDACERLGYLTFKPALDAAVEASRAA